MKPTLLLVAIVLMAGGMGLAAGGPVPGDIAVTYCLQSMLGSEPRWAEILTASAKAPLLGVTILLGAVLAGLAGGWRGSLAVPLAYALVWLCDKTLRVIVFVPKPEPDLVAVASASAASGLPSTFGLVYASVFGVAIWLKGCGRIRDSVRMAAGGLIIAGSGARIVLGGHWTSQMIASAAAGLLLSGIALWAVSNRARRPAPSP